MRAGRLDRKITIQKPVKTQDAYGQEIEGWVDHAADIWAAVMSASSSERFRESQHLSQSDTVFRIRYRSDITAEMRVVYDGENYTLEGPPIELGRREGLDLPTKAHRL